MKNTTLLGINRLSKKERQKSDADFVFIREDVDTGREYRIYVSAPSGDYSWSQWGADMDVLCENVDNIEEFFAIH